MSDKHIDALKLAREALESLFNGKADEHRAKRLIGCTCKGASLKHKHEWGRYFSPVARWDGVWRYRCHTCDERIESYVGQVQEIEDAIRARGENNENYIR